MRFTFLMVLLSLACAAAQADVWMWVDTNGDTHFVDTNTPIYMWIDTNGEVYYSDTPDHEDAVSVELVWISGGSLDEMRAANGEPGSSNAEPGETPEEAAERKEAEAYYCKRATEIYESYVNAPRLYKTNDAGERVYLNEEDAARTIAETRAQKDEFCH